MDPGQLVVPVAGIVAAAALTFYLVSFQEMSNKSFEDLEEKLAKGTNNVLLNSSLSSKKRREARRISKQQRQQQASKPGSSRPPPDSASSKD
jgi:ABC-type antimicrobial peptide transport system permease subunit